MSSTREVLIAARAAVVRRWIQGDANDLHGGVCVQYAIYRESDRRGTQPAYAEQVYLEAIEDVTGKRTYNIPRWNDDPYRSKAEVLAVFDRAIEKCGKPDPKPDPPIGAKIVLTIPPPTWHAVTAATPVETTVVAQVRELVGV